MLIMLYLYLKEEYMKSIEEIKRIRERDEEDDLKRLQENIAKLAQLDQKLLPKIPIDKDIYHTIIVRLIIVSIVEFLVIAGLCAICTTTMAEVITIADDLVESNKLNVDLQNKLEYYSNFVTESANHPEK